MWTHRTVPDDIPFPIDYTRSVLEVYQDVTKRMINSKLDLGALQVRESRLNTSADLPKWVVDYRSRIPRLLIYNNNTTYWQTFARPQDLTYENKLVLQGICV